MSGARGGAPASSSSRKKRRNDKHIDVGMGAFFDTIVDTDIVYINEEMQPRKELVAPIARMIREGVIDRSLQATAPVAPAKDYCRKLGAGCRLFSKIGVNNWRKFYSEVCKTLTIHKSDDCDEDRLLDIGCFALGVQRCTRLPNKHKNCDYELEALP